MTHIVNIVGNGGHGKMLQGVMRSLPGGNADYRLWALDETPSNQGHIVVGIGNMVKIGDSGLSWRRKTYEKFASARIIGVVASSAVVLGFASDTTQIMPTAVVQVGAEVWNNTIVNTGAIVEHDCYVGKHCHIAPRAVLCGRVTVGDETHIGAGSVVRQGLTIGPRCVVAMGSVVTKNIPEGKTWFKGEIV